MLRGTEPPPTAIGKYLAETMGSAVGAESQGPGQGRTFRFTIRGVPAELPQGQRRDFPGQQPASAGKRILAVAANAMQRDREACLEAAMDDCVTQPIWVDAPVQAPTLAAQPASD